MVFSPSPDMLFKSKPVPYSFVHEAIVCCCAFPDYHSNHELQEPLLVVSITPVPTERVCEMVCIMGNRIDEH